MKRIYLTLLAITALALCSCSSTTSETAKPTSSSPAPSAATTASPTENVEQVLTKLEQEWADAIVKRDLATIDRIVAEDFLLTDLPEQQLTKAMHLETIKSGSYAASTLTLDAMKVRVFGDTAIATYNQTEKSQTKGQDSSGRYHLTDVWLKRNGKWQVVTEHYSHIEKPKAK